MKLIPVVELRGDIQGVVCLQPLESELSLYSIDLISNDNLKKIVIDRTEGLRNGDYERDGACPLSGGYVLEIDGERLFYPQCCGDLGDIQFWRNISNGSRSYYEGHPAPVVKFENEYILFDLTVERYGEEFWPIPIKRMFRFKKEDLKKAILEVEKTLEKFANRIAIINQSEKLNIERIEDLLVWENDNYE